MDSVVDYLKQIITKYPTSIEDGKKLRSILKDFFPEDKQVQNQLYMVYEEGIVKDMMSSTMIDRFKMLGYITCIRNEYGISRSMAREAIENWAKAVDLKLEMINDEEYNDSELFKNEEDHHSGEISTKYHFSGEGRKVVTNVVIQKGLYLAKSQGEHVFSVFFIDSNRKKDHFNHHGGNDEQIVDFEGLDLSKPLVLEITHTFHPWEFDLIKTM